MSQDAGIKAQAGAGEEGRPQARAAGRSGELAAFGVCVLVGTLLSIVPNLIFWPMVGGPYCTYDGDDYTVYTPFAATAYFNGPKGFSDSFSAEGDATHYPPLVF